MSFISRDIFITHQQTVMNHSGNFIDGAFHNGEHIIRSTSYVAPDKNLVLAMLFFVFNTAIVIHSNSMDSRMYVWDDGRVGLKKSDILEKSIE